MKVSKSVFSMAWRISKRTNAVAQRLILDVMCEKGAVPVRRNVQYEKVSNWVNRNFSRTPLGERWNWMRFAGVRLELKD
jgi:hypothetical protein